MIGSAIASRSDQIRRGLRLEYFTIFWNALEALGSLIAGLIAGSVALVAFGADSLIEVISGIALIWRLRGDFDVSRREGMEATAFAGRWSVLHGLGVVHPIGISIDLVCAQSTRTEHLWNSCGRRSSESPCLCSHEQSVVLQPVSGVALCVLIYNTPTSVHIFPRFF